MSIFTLFNIFLIFFLDYADIFRLNLEEHRRQIPSSPAATHEEKASLGYQSPPPTSVYSAINKLWMYYENN